MWNVIDLSLRKFQIYRIYIISFKAGMILSLFSIIDLARPRRYFLQRKFCLLIEISTYRPAKIA